MVVVCLEGIIQLYVDCVMVFVGDGLEIVVGWFEWQWVQVGDEQFVGQVVVIDVQLQLFVDCFEFQCVVEQVVSGDVCVWIVCYVQCVGVV